MTAKNLADHADTLLAAQSKKKLFPGVTGAEANAQLEANGMGMEAVITGHDIRGVYRRPCFDVAGKPTGDFDEITQSTRAHFSLIGKGWSLDRFVPDERSASSMRSDGPTGADGLRPSFKF